MRTAIYARYSSDRQSDASVEDQLRLCREHTERHGWEIVAEEADHAMSGAVLLRPGLQRLLERGRRREIDVVLTESLDRISRSQADIAAIFDQLVFNDVKIVTLSEGLVSELHVGIGGTMSALYLKQLAEKTRRGLRGRIEQGRSAGGCAYGYRAVRDEHGNPGKLAIVPEQAEIIRRIFQDYVSGKSPRAIAKALNREGVPGPSAKGWTASTIIGNRKRGTGLLNNTLYRGQRVWNRLHYRRHPETRKRVSQLNPADEWIVTEVPELRVIDENLWARAQTLEESRSRETCPHIRNGPDWRHRRAKHLLSGLIKCGACGGGMTLISRVYYGCSANRNKGTCANRLTMRLDRLEEAVLRGLQSHLLTPELTATFVREYTAEINRLRSEAEAIHSGSRQRLDMVSRQIANIVDAVADGRANPALLDKLSTLEEEKARLESELNAPKPEPIRFHPNAAELYVAKVRDLRTALNAQDTRDEAATILRTLIDEIRLHPVDGELWIQLKGELATLLAFAQSASHKRKPGSIEPGYTESLVAGARNHLYRTITSWRKQAR